MSKCICCGSSCLTRGRIKLMDADICFKCFDALGFDHKLEFYVARNLYKWDEIKDGKVAYLKNKLKFVQATLDIYIVQPGVSKNQITDEMHQILCGTQAYLLDTYGIVLRLICSD